MKKLFKKLVVFVATTVFSCSAFVGCFNSNDAVKPTNPPTTNLSVPVFTEDKSYVIFADVPTRPTVEHLQVYKDAGFTHYNMTEDWLKLTNVDNVFGNEDDGVLNPEYLKALEACETVGIEVVIRNYYGDSDYFLNDAEDGDRDRLSEAPWYNPYKMPKRAITTQLTEYDAVDGYYMGDEPSYQRISTFEKLINWYNSYGSKSNFTEDDSLWHLNLLQSYGADYFKGYSYEEYVDHYCDVVLKNVKGAKTLGTDYYPLVKGDLGEANYIKVGLLNDYFVIANKTKEMIKDGHDVRTNFCIQSYENPKSNAGQVRELVSQADITFQTNLAMAFGTKSFQYYTYKGYGSEPGIVDGSSLKPTKMYPWVQEANRQAQVLADMILNFNWQGAKLYQGQQKTDDYNIEAFTEAKKYELDKFALISDVTARLDTVVSEFKDANGNFGYMLVNYSEPSMQLSGKVIVNFSSVINKAVLYVDGEKSVVDVVDSKIILDLSAGGSVFLYPYYEGGAK